MQRHFMNNITMGRRAYMRCMEPVCIHWGLTMLDVNILLFLRRYPGLNRAADVVIGCGAAKSQVSVAINHLEQLGYLAKCPAPDDRRSTHLSLLPAAEPVLAEASELKEHFLDMILTGFTQEELSFYQTISKKISHNLEAYGDVRDF